MKTTLYTEQSQSNPYAKIGFFLFLFSLIVLDCILGTIVSAIGGNYKVIFYISLVTYLISIGLGIVSILRNKELKARGMNINGTLKFEILSIGLSTYLILLNVTQVLMK